jgi:hypothetical protein
MEVEGRFGPSPQDPQVAADTPSSIWTLANGKKAALLAVTTSSLPQAREGSVELAEGLQVLFQMPLEAPALLKQWLGSLAGEQFQQSNLVIIASAISEKPGVTDGQVPELERQVKEVFLGLLLQGAPFGFRGGILLSAERCAGELDVRQMTKLDPVLRVVGTKAICLDDRNVAEAGRIAEALRTRVMVGGFRRFRGGFASWHRSVLEASPDERLHGFVRSLDGLMILPTGKSRKTFRQRGQLLIGKSGANEQLLDEIYELRSTTSHLNDFEDVLVDYPEEGRNVTGLLRSFQAEQLATEVYRRILSSNDLLERFRDDDSIAMLWQLGESEFSGLFGTPIDLDGTSRARFTDATTRVFPAADLISRIANPSGTGTEGGTEQNTNSE